MAYCKYILYIDVGIPTQCYIVTMYTCDGTRFQTNWLEGEGVENDHNMNLWKKKSSLTYSYTVLYSSYCTHRFYHV